MSMILNKLWEREENKVGGKDGDFYLLSVMEETQETHPLKIEL